MFAGMDTLQILMILGIGIGCALSVIIFMMGLYVFLNTRETPVRDRLMSMKRNSAETDNDNDGLKSIKETFLEFTAPIAQNLYGGNVTYLQRIKSTLTEAGLPDTDVAVKRLIAARVACGLFIGGVLGFCGLLTGQIMMAAILLIVGMLVGANFVELRLKGVASKRKSEIRFTLSDTLDLMVVCMEAGLGLDATISRVAEETERISPDLAQEFRRLTKELNAGIPRIEAFHNLGSRSGVEELKALCALIIQTDKLGTSIADTLRIYADDVRTKRRQRAELLASQASIKMTFPLVLLIFPPMFIVLIGPAVIQTLGIFFGAK